MSNLTQFTTGGVKSIQTGVSFNGAGANMGQYSEAQTVSVTISAVNPAKSYIILNLGGYVFVSTGYYALTPALASLTSTAFTYIGGYYVSGAYTYYNRISWQVIEYY